MVRFQDGALQSMANEVAILSGLVEHLDPRALAVPVAHHDGPADGEIVAPPDPQRRQSADLEPSRNMMERFFRSLMGFLFACRIFYLETRTDRQLAMTAKWFFLKFGSMEGFDPQYVHVTRTGSPVPLLRMVKEKLSDARGKFRQLKGEDGPHAVLCRLVPGLAAMIAAAAAAGAAADAEEPPNHDGIIGAGNDNQHQVVPAIDEEGMRAVARIIISAE